MVKLIKTSVTLSSLLLCGQLFALCNFDSEGTISNPNDPACKDARFTYTENDNSGDNIALGFTPPQPVDSLTPVDGFRSYASLFARHQDLMLQYPHVSGQVIGQTVNGRDIWAYTLSDSNSNTLDGAAEGASLFTGGVHAREWQSPEAMSGILEYMAENKDSDPVVAYLIDNFNTNIIPVLNVDGFMQTQKFPLTVSADDRQPREGRMRRKNLRNLTNNLSIDQEISTSDDNFFGIDLNRNQPTGFGNPQRSSSNQVSLVHRGPSPQSEPESQALATAATLGPENRLRFYIDTHSFTQIYFTPMTGNARRDAITTELASRSRAVTGFKYRYGPSNPGSEIGSTDGHFATTYQIPAWTLETEPLNDASDYGGTAAHGHSGFILPESEVARMRSELTPTYLLGLYRQSGPPRLQAAKIRDIDNDSIVYDASWSNVSGSARSLNVVTNTGLSPDTRYQLWLAFDRPMRHRVADQIANYPGQNVDLVPNITLEYPDNDASDDITITGDRQDWLNQPTTGDFSFLNYANDALVLEFVTAASNNPDNSITAVLSISAQDMMQAGLDADPGSVVDWQNGSWINYENAVGTAGDVGGTDCNFSLFLKPGSAPDAAAPDTDSDCRAKQTSSEPEPPPVPVAPPAPPNSSSGGGSLSFFELLILVACLSLIKYRRLHTSRTKT